MFEVGKTSGCDGVSETVESVEWSVVIVVKKFWRSPRPSSVEGEEVEV